MLIPVKDENDVVCMYDKISDTYFRNAGTGDFIAGPEKETGIYEETITDNNERINNINKHVSLNTLSRIWQVMVAAVPEMQAATNQKQCFDMLIVRLMHIADMPPIAEMIKQEKTSAPVAPVQKAEPKKLEIKTATDLANALSNAREMLMYSYFTKNIEVSEIVNNKIAYFFSA